MTPDPKETAGVLIDDDEDDWDIEVECGRKKRRWKKKRRPRNA